MKKILYFTHFLARYVLQLSARLCKMSIAQLSKCLKRQKLNSFRIGVDIMSNRLFQGVIHQMRDAVDRTIGVIDETGTIISCSELGKIGEVISNASQIFAEDGDRIVNGCTYRSALTCRPSMLFSLTAKMSLQANMRISAAWR